MAVFSPSTLATTWPEQPLSDRRTLLRHLISRVTINPNRLDLHLDTAKLIATLQGATSPDREPNETQPTAAPIPLTIPVLLKRAGLEMRMLVEGTGSTADPDPTLIKLILRAQHLRDRLLTDRLGVGELAAAEGVTTSYIARVIRLGFLAPDIITAILNGRQPIGLTANKLANDSRLPITWPEQRQTLRFAQP